MWSSWIAERCGRWRPTRCKADWTPATRTAAAAKRKVRTRRECDHWCSRVFQSLLLSWWLLFVVCCLLFVVCCLFVVCLLLFVVVCCCFVVVCCCCCCFNFLSLFSFFSSRFLPDFLAFPSSLKFLVKVIGRKTRL